MSHSGAKFQGAILGHRGDVVGGWGPRVGVGSGASPHFPGLGGGCELRSDAYSDKIGFCCEHTTGTMVTTAGCQMVARPGFRSHLNNNNKF